jgi:[ribosomal protein S5]-alanine N-acetyltransferase
MLPLTTERLVIRDLTPGDFDNVHEYACDPVVTRYLSWGPNTEQDTREFLVRVAREASKQPRRNYELAVAYRDTDSVVGVCGLLSRAQDYSEFEIGYCFKRDAWGRGIATEVVRALLPFAFEHLCAHRVYARVDPDNPPSARVLERLGFRREGQLRKDTLVRGEWRDSMIYALLEEEWISKR